MKNYYESGKIRDSLTLNSDSVKNGKSFYFAEDGELDSIVTFQNGKHNGLKSKFFGEYGIYTYEYKNDSLVEQRNYDMLNRLIYLAPLDVNSVPKTTFKLMSSKVSFDQDKGDTILIINPELPSFNREIEVKGALLRNLKEQNMYALTTSKHFDSLKAIIIKINIFEKNITGYHIPTRIDTLTIPVK